MGGGGGGWAGEENEDTGTTVMCDGNKFAMRLVRAAGS
jgi:hypothetical protein